ncbi:hypothetical protein ACF1AB_32050 [Streptomyces sp. NPDC014846]|uniref:hypothetical protein n=1 Tax=Streptomyces sp. NPDC014846 TaxID=3364922 RepID=UPI0037022F9D
MVMVAGVRCRVVVHHGRRLGAGHTDRSRGESGEAGDTGDTGQVTSSVHHENSSDFDF